MCFFVFYILFTLCINVFAEQSNRLSKILHRKVWIHKTTFKQADGGSEKVHMNKWRPNSSPCLTFCLLDGWLLAYTRQHMGRLYCRLAWLVYLEKWIKHGKKLKIKKGASQHVQIYLKWMLELTRKWLTNQTRTCITSVAVVNI